MYRKALALTLLGVLLVGGATLLYGAAFDGGIGRTIAALGDGEKDHGEDHEWDDDD